MNEPRWVQHVSGQGAKWELTEYELADGHEGDLDYEVYTTDPDDKYFYLPKSEYRLCEPPERWLTEKQHPLYVHLEHLFDECGKEIRGTFRARLDCIERKQP